MESFDKDELLNDWINNKKSWGKKAKEINVPIKIFSSVIKSLFPVKGTEAYYQFLIDRYINEEALRNKLQKGASVKSLAKCLNGLHARKNRAMLNRINSTIKVIHGYK